STGRVLLGVTATVAGILLLTGASIGALLRRTHHVVRRAGSAARKAPARTRPRETAATIAQLPAIPVVHEPPVDAAAAFPDIIGERRLDRAPQLELTAEERDELSEELGLPVVKPRGEYRLPDRALLRRSPPSSGGGADTSDQVAGALVSALGHFGIE